MTRVAIAAGGTAGHVVPALAIADALRDNGAHVEFIGGERAEAELVPSAGYPIHSLRVAGLDRRNPLKAARALLWAGWATGRARRVLRAMRADIVVGGGGYVAAPVGLAARSLRLPIVLTEADSHLGIANRMLAPFAKRIFLAFDLAGHTGSKWVVTGRPIPADVVRADRDAARGRFGIDDSRECLLVFGGSLGARRVNEAAIEAFGPAAPCWVLHAAGRRDYDDLARRLDELGRPEHYKLYPYITPFADAYAAADLAVARAGGSVFELLAAGTPSVLVPYPHATADHQTKNADWVERGGAAIVVPDEELDGPRLAREVAALLGSSERLRNMQRAAQALARPDAAEWISQEILMLACK
jgi:UDP-N-acetylglucosamine--N-acetylmuramyl-(pentapeptide) pyrophosphoryl-undecaprenol N-acetylglucosamine transferase